MELSALIALVEGALVKMGITPSEARNEGEGQWFLLNEELPIYLDAWEETESTPWNYFKFKEDRSIFQIAIPFCHAPTLKRQEFFEELLTVNINLHYGKFSFNAPENVVVLVYRKPGSSLLASEIPDVIDALGYYTEMTYHVLKDEFNLKRVAIEEGK